MSQKELAAQLSVDPSTLARWERGYRMPAGEFLNRMKTVLGTATEAAKANGARFL